MEGCAEDVKDFTRNRSNERPHTLYYLFDSHILQSPMKTSEHFQVKWIRFTVENASHSKTRADSMSMETVLAGRDLSRSQNPKCGAALCC